MSRSQLSGLHAVQAALDYAPQKIIRIWIDSRRRDARLTELLAQCQDLAIVVEAVDRAKLDRFAQGKNHQGIVAEVELPRMRSETELKQAVENLTVMPFFFGVRSGSRPT
jgi:23S rRNA (guanosine2251-2'-O)-methyltransferase